MEGVKVFNKDKIVGTLSPDESYLFGILTSKVEEGYKEIIVKNKEIGFSKVQYKSKIRIIRRQNQDRIQVEVNSPRYITANSEGVSQPGRILQTV